MNREQLFIVLLLLPTVAAARCQDGLCESVENYLTCSQDCPSGGYDHYCDNEVDDRCDPDCLRSDKDCADYEINKEIVNIDESPNTGRNVIIVTIFLVVVTSALYILYVRANKTAKYYEKEQIDKFSNVKKESDQDSWAHQSEGEIINRIKDSEDFQKYANK